MFRRAGLVAAILVLLTTSGASAATATVKMTSYKFTQKTQSVKLGNSVKWKNTSTRRHTATPSVNWSWNGVDVAAGTTSAAVAPTQAGSFPYFCSFHPSQMKGTIKVPMTVTPAGGNTSTYFQITVGTVTAPGVSVHDIYIRRNGGAWQLRASTANPMTSFFFTQTGDWDIRTRMRWQLGGQVSGWSPIASVVVF